MEEIEEFVRLQQQNIALLSRIRQKRSEYSRAIRNNIGEVVFTHTGGSPRTIQENGKFIVVSRAVLSHNEQAMTRNAGELCWVQLDQNRL